MYKRSIIMSILVFLLLITTPQAMAAEFVDVANPRITADSAAVIEEKSGMIIYSKNGSKQRPPASLTKMMTAILAAQYGNLEQEVTVGNKPPSIPPSKLYLRQGEKILLNDLLKAALMKSANDACVAIAEHVGGEEAYFVYLMNLKSWALALKDTHFENTNGLPAKNHYSTAIDLARIGVYAKSIPIIREYVSKKEDTILRRGQEQRLGNTNKLLWSYVGANGIKTGTTNAAGQCLASSARNQDEEYVGIVLHSDNRYGDSSKILNYAFENFKIEKIISKDNIININIKNKTIRGKVYADIYYPYKEGEEVKTYIKAYNNNKNIKTGNKCALLAVVTPDSVLWYDIYAVENKQNLTKSPNFIDYLYKFFHN